MRVHGVVPSRQAPRACTSTPRTGGRWREFLLREPALRLDWLANLSGVDYVADERFAVVYDLYSYDLRHGFAVKVFCPREDPHVAQRGGPVAGGGLARARGV